MNQPIHPSMDMVAWESHSPILLLMSSFRAKQRMFDVHVTHTHCQLALDQPEKPEDAIGEGGAISFSRCIYGFQNVGSCSVNTSTFMDNGAAAKGGAIQISGDTGASFVEFNRCLVSNNSAGTNIEDDPQGDGGAFSVGTGVSLLLEECVVQTSYAGNKVGIMTRVSSSVR